MENQAQLHSLLPRLSQNSLLRALFDQYNDSGTLKNCKLEPSFGPQLDKSGKVEPASQWSKVSHGLKSTWKTMGFLRRCNLNLRSPFLKLTLTCLGIEMNYEIVCNHLNRSFQVGPSSTSPVDLDDFWGY
jgi:hypothetical protein